MARWTSSRKAFRSSGSTSASSGVTSRPAASPHSGSHRVQAGSIVQTGDPLSRDLTKMREWGTGGSGYKGAPKPVGVAEPAKKKFERGIVGLAYQTNRKPETADSQFFILLSPNPALNGKYAALGKVIKGMDVLAKIEMQDLIKNVSVR